MSQTYIRLPTLTLDLLVGVYPVERLQTQRIALDLKLKLALCPASRTDDLCDTLDYDHVIERVRALTALERPKLLEHFAGRLADDLLLRFSVLEAIEIKLGKQLNGDPPVYVEVIHERSRGDSD